jgi:pyridoxamine 5'-phosphate oxidase
MEQNPLANQRKEYRKAQLNEDVAGSDPIKFFGKWLDEAMYSELPEPTAMVLSTVSPQGQPSSRTVLLKGLDKHGFVFFTHYESRKGTEIARNNKVSLLFLWLDLERQVRVEGTVKKISNEISDEYFYSRPAISQVSAIISPQSKVVPDRKYLEDLKDKYLQDAKINHQRPPYWGGYVVAAEKIEFWQGRPGRLHDRILFVKEKDEWLKMRLAP